MQYLNVPLLKPSARDLFFKSVCVTLAYGSVNDAEKKFNFYCSEDPTILETREEQFMKKAIEALKEKKIDLIKEAITKFKSCCDFDKWKVNVFKRIHDNIQEKEDDYLGGDGDEKPKEEVQNEEDNYI